MITSSNVLWKNVTSNNTDDFILWIADDLSRNAKISVNVYRFLPHKKIRKHNVLVLVVAQQLFGENCIQRNVQNDWPKVRTWAIFSRTSILLSFEMKLYIDNQYDCLVHETIHFLMCLCAYLKFKVFLGDSNVIIKWLNIPISLCDMFIINYFYKKLQIDHHCMVVVFFAPNGFDCRDKGQNFASTL